jgi:hypothetical protein
VSTPSIGVAAFSRPDAAAANIETEGISIDVEKVAPTRP